MYSTHKILLAFVYILEIEMTDNYIGTRIKKKPNENNNNCSRIKRNISKKNKRFFF